MAEGEKELLKAFFWPPYTKHGHAHTSDFLSVTDILIVFLTYAQSLLYYFSNKWNEMNTTSYSLFTSPVYLKGVLLGTKDKHSFSLLVSGWN